MHTLPGAAPTHTDSHAAGVVYLNGRYRQRDEARLDVEDRGSLFGDGVYEVVAFFNGRPLAMEAHARRLRQSLAAIGMDPAAGEGLDAVSIELAARNQLENGLIYWQITRGAAPRHHLAPPAGLRPTVLAMAYAGQKLDLHAPPPTIRAALAEDQRWCRCDIKSLMLLPSVLAMAQARDRGCDDAILHRGPRVTEATRASVFAVRKGELWTHPADQWVLASITRAIVLELAGGAGLTVHERAVTVDELLAADEVFICGTASRIKAVTHIEGRPIGDGAVGPVTLRLGGALTQHIARACGPAALVTRDGSGGS
jgi:D-alanine transaminase